MGRRWEWEVPGPGGASPDARTHCSSCSSRFPYWSRKYSARSSSSMMPRLMAVVTQGPRQRTLHSETLGGGATGGSGVVAWLLLPPSSALQDPTRAGISETLGKMAGG